MSGTTEVTARQSQKIRLLVEAGKTPDEAFAIVLGREPEKGEVPATPKKNKYGAKKITDQGFTFDSLKEHRRFLDLMTRVKVGEIDNLEVHPSYRFEVNGTLIGTFTPDFKYRNLTTMEWVVEDVKSAPTKTTAYRLRKKMLKAFYGIDLQEV